MTPLLTVAQLAVWARQPIAVDDEFAIAVIEAASLVVSDAARHPDWVDIIAPELALVPAPGRAVLIACQLAKRTFLNPDAIIAEGGIGPIGGDRFVEDFARTLELTETETNILADMQPEALIGNGLWVQTVESGRSGSLATTIYLPDGSNLDAELIPMGSVGVDDYFYTPLGLA